MALVGDPDRYQALLRAQPSLLGGDCLLPASALLWGVEEGWAGGASSAGGGLGSPGSQPPEPPVSGDPGSGGLFEAAARFSPTTWTLPPQGE